MDPITAHLEPRFGSFPEPVIILSQGEVIYRNEEGQRLLKNPKCPLDLLAALSEHPGGVMEISLGDEIYRVTVSPLDEGDLLVFRPIPVGEEKKHPFSNAVFRMRECLSMMNASHLRLHTLLKDQDIPDLEYTLAYQRQSIIQMLRLTRQAELTQELNNKVFPREEGFDLAAVCQGMAEEASWLADLCGVTFTYESNVTMLPYKGSKSLLTQMLLALVSNGVRAAGRGGKAELRFHAEAGRVVISMRDSGVGIPEDRLANLFNGDAVDEVPRPGEGAGLGLYNARRIATLHGGVLVAQSGQDGGTSLVISMPIHTPSSVPLRNHPGYDNQGGFSPVLIELSDVLPWQAFVPGEGKK
jgi:signal transduction histidine kinase